MASKRKDPLQDILDQAKGLKDEEDSAFPEGEVEIEEEEDGGATVTVNPKAESKVKEKTEHTENLAEVLEEHELNAISVKLLEQIDQDKQDRKKRDEQYAEGLKRSGLTGSAPGGADFDGASMTVHPMLTEACIDFSAQMLREFLPNQGPTKMRLRGKQTQERVNSARRQRETINWQLTENVSEFATEFEQLQTQLPMGGSQFQKFWNSPSLGRWTTEFVPVDYVHIPFYATDFYTSPRVTHEQHLDPHEFESRVMDGFYADLELSIPSSTTEKSKTDEINEEIEGVEHNAVGTSAGTERIVYETSTFLELSIDGEESKPYLISIDENSRKVLGLYRNWAEGDKKCRKLDWMVEWGFIPWRGAYKLSLFQIIGSLQISATGALRALLDSAHIQNTATALYMKGSGAGGESPAMQVTQLTEIKAPTGVDDIRKLVMAVPFNPPSQTLFQLLGWLTDAGKGVIITAEEKIGEANNQMPVGTTLALIEQGAKVMSTIHMRGHRSFRKMLQIISRLNREGGIDEEEGKKALGEDLASPGDFDEVGIQPVSDPAVFTQSQRYAQMQLVLQLAGDQRVKYDVQAVHERILQIAEIPDAEKLLPKVQQPKPLNAAAENVAAMAARPLQAFPEQDHISHIQVHVRFLLDPFLGASPMTSGQTVQMIIENIKQHINFLYLDMIDKAMEGALPKGKKVSDMLSDKKTQHEVDEKIAQMSLQLHQNLNKMLQPLGPLLQQSLQLAQQKAPPPPSDPQSVAARAQQTLADAKAKEVETKAPIAQAQAQAAAATAQAKQQELAVGAQESQMELQARAQELQVEQAAAQQDLALRAQEGAANAQKSQREAALAVRKQQMEERHAAEKLALEQEREQNSVAATSAELMEQAREHDDQMALDQAHERNEAAKFALQIQEDREQGNQISGV